MAKNKGKKLHKLTTNVFCYLLQDMEDLLKKEMNKPVEDRNREISYTYAQLLNAARAFLKDNEVVFESDELSDLEIHRKNLDAKRKKREAKQEETKKVLEGLSQEPDFL